jgi:hypothetical protein
MTPRFVLYLLLLLTVFVIGMVRYKNRTAPFKALTLFVGVTFISELMTRVVTYKLGYSSPVYHVYIIAMYLFYAWMYRQLCSSHAIRKAILISVPVFIGLAVMNTLYYQSLKRFPSNMLQIACVLIVVLSLIIYRQMFHYPIEENLFRQPVFWLNTGTLFFYTTTFLLLSFLNYFVSQKLNIVPLRDMLYISGIIYYVILGIALLV